MLTSIPGQHRESDFQTIVSPCRFTQVISRSKTGLPLNSRGRLDLVPHRLVFIDKTGAGTRMARLHGRAPREERL